jgi:triacylglycerol lipase
METINGVTFEDWAAACGNLSQGMPEEKIMQVLGIEKPIWDDTMEKWGKRLGEMMMDDMNVATTYGELFANPAAGKFAGVANSSGALGIDQVLPIAPDYETYQKLFWHQSIASKYGIDPITTLELYGLDIGKWGVLNMHYMKYQNKLLDYTQPDYNEKFEYFSSLQQHWENHFEEYYKNEKVDLGGDINF